MDISDRLQKKSDNQIITVRETSGYLDETEKALVTNNDTVFKEVNTNMGTKPNVVKESITPPIEKVRSKQLKNREITSIQ